MRHISLLWAHFFFLGFFPLFPGTFTSAAVSLAYGLWLVHLGIWYKIGLVVFVVLTGIPAASQGEKYHRKKDPRSVVIDEVAGQLLALLTAVTWTQVLTGFLLFRLFDTLKPPPVKTAEGVPGGLGIMLDDLVAGALSLLILVLFQNL